MINLTSVIISEAEPEDVDIDKLIDGVAKGDIPSFEALYESMKAAVYSYALAILKNTRDAEDVLHDCFVNVYSAAASYRKKGRAKAWIMTITRNLCIQQLRQRKRVSDLPQEDWEPYLENLERVSPEDIIVLEQCMNLLSDEERQIVVLHAVSGFKHREVAEMLGISLSTVLSKYNRAIRKLRETM